MSRGSLKRWVGTLSRDRGKRSEISGLVINRLVNALISRRPEFPLFATKKPARNQVLLISKLSKGIHR